MSGTMAFDTFDQIFVKFIFFRVLGMWTFLSNNYQYINWTLKKKNGRKVVETFIRTYFLLDHENSVYRKWRRGGEAAGREIIVQDVCPRMADFETSRIRAGAKFHHLNGWITMTKVEGMKKAVSQFHSPYFTARLVVRFILRLWSRPSLDLARYEVCLGHRGQRSFIEEDIDNESLLFGVAATFSDSRTNSPSLFPDLPFPLSMFQTSLDIIAEVWIKSKDRD